MPVNQILAQTYLKVFYEVIPNIVHSMRLYIEAPLTVVPEGESYFAGVTDATHVSGWTVAEVVVEFIERLYNTHTTLVPQMNILRVEMWESNAGANTYLGNDGGDYAPYNAVGGSNVPSAYLMYVFQTAARDQWRVSMFDTKSSNPQRTAVASIPVIDNGSFAWFVVRGTVPFSNQDGIALNSAASYNTGYNRALARAYGKTLTP